MADPLDLDALTALAHEAVTLPTPFTHDALAEAVPALIAHSRALHELVGAIDAASEEDPETTEHFDAWEAVWAKLAAARVLLEGNQPQ